MRSRRRESRCVLYNGVMDLADKVEVNKSIKLQLRNTITVLDLALIKLQIKLPK